MTVTVNMPLLRFCNCTDLLFLIRPKATLYKDDTTHNMTTNPNCDVMYIAKQQKSTTIISSPYGVVEPKMVSHSQVLPRLLRLHMK